MKASLLKIVERQVAEFRQRIGLSDAESVNVKSLLLKLNVLTVYRPMSEKFSGMSLKSPTGEMFMLVNSNQPRCRQHFTIAHELYHLFVEKNPTPHNCEIEGGKNPVEQCADAFAMMLLMPESAVLQLIPEAELKKSLVSLGSVIKMEHYFSVSRQAMLNRLCDLGYISRAARTELSGHPVIRSAKEYGYDTTLYQPGNEGLVIGNFGEKARKLFDEEKISEGHYRELLSKIGIYDYED